MRQELTNLLCKLLDETDSLGVGAVDANGLVIQCQGAHAALDSTRIAAHLAHRIATGLEELTGDPFDEQILVGRRYTFMVRWFLDRRFFLYAMTHRGTRGGPVRFGIRIAVEALEEQFSGDGLFLAMHQRLEEPRKFPSSRLIRQTPESGR